MRVLVTGATGLIGKAITRALLKRGDTVVYTTTNKEKIALMQVEMGADDTKLVGIELDLTDDNASEKLADELAERAIKIDYLVNNARSLESVKITDYHDIKRDKWQGEYLLDVIVPYELTMKIAAMNTLKGVVNISSMYGLIGYNDYLCSGSNAISINYGTAKAALIQLTRELAVRLAPTVQVNAISFGGVAGRADNAFLARYKKLVPTEKMLAPEETAGHVLYLCSKASSGMTGANLVVDGGFTAW